MDGWAYFSHVQDVLCIGRVGRWVVIALLAERGKCASLDDPPGAGVGRRKKEVELL